MWLLSALGAAVALGFSSAIDSVLANRVFVSSRTLMFYSSLFNAVFLPFLLLFITPSVLPPAAIGIVLLVGFLDIIYLFPYYRAVREADASVVNALLSFSRILTPFFAYFLLDERLGIGAYIGFTVILLAGSLLSVKPGHTFKFNAAFWYMLLTSAIISIDVVLYKQLYTIVDWPTGYTWGALSGIAWLVIITFCTSKVKDLKDGFSAFKASFGYFALNESLTFIGFIATAYALARAPVTAVTAAYGFTPFFAIGAAWLLRRLPGHNAQEDLSTGSVIKKSILFAVILGGLLLVAQDSSVIL